MISESVISEFRVVQNEALGGLALWMFTTEYSKVKNLMEGPTIPIIMPVLPLIFHRETAKKLYRRRRQGGLHIALAEDRTIVAGLQDRMEAMVEQTFASLNLAIAAGLIDYDETSQQLFPLRYAEPLEILVGDVRMIVAVAKRLGFWFGSHSFEQCLRLLKVGF